ncbi:hypothetical protein [Actomonas aquatica]|uniref:Uncharacterized protein n=1 Tax=Actomonas aquatica TaxID=2866162 RepID=A0ABZ1C5M7_9BACT|nr:hypothetical protein [Opitutus sp. WL0086]WRQ86660.1 hypothetical protein K1X11_017750 [Opitutus sp. WL0086]
MKRSLSLLLACCALSLSTLVAQPVMPTESAAPALPGQWQSVPVSERLMAVRAAQLDAMRLLAESVYGTELGEGSAVIDFVGAASEVRAETDAALRGVILGEPVFFADGRVGVPASIKLREVVQRLRLTFSRPKMANRLHTHHVKILDSVDEEALERKVEVLGSAALEGSAGQSKLLAKRAAEVDAYRRLAERILGTEVSSDTKIADFAVESDRICSRLARIIRGAEYVSIQFLSDEEATVDLRVAYADIDRMLRDEIAQGQPIRPLTRKQAGEFLVERGRGAASAAVPPPAITAGADPFADVHEIVTAVSETEVVIDG